MQPVNPIPFSDGLRFHLPDVSLLNEPSPLEVVPRDIFLWLLGFLDSLLEEVPRFYTRSGIVHPAKAALRTERVEHPSDRARERAKDEHSTNIA